MLARCEQLKPDGLSTTNVFLVGLNHRTAPMELREQLALTDETLRLALDDLPTHTGLVPDNVIEEVVILSTCNRLEVYVAATSTSGNEEAVRQLVANLGHVSLEHLHPHLYVKSGEAAITHLMQVAAGLDSMILGEQQILGQVKQALSVAQIVGTAGPILSHLFTQAAHTGKRARSETDISRYVTSMSHAAVKFVEAQFHDLSQIHALVVGSGEMALLAAQALHRHGVTHIGCINRTYARAEALARQVEGYTLDWHHLPEALAQADVVITATGAPHTVIHRRDVEQALVGRNDQPLVVVDIALPRDVETSVGELPNVRYYDMDDLNAFVEANITRREAAIAQVEEIISEETARYKEWQYGRRVAPVISALREKAVAVAQDEVEAALRRLGPLDSNEQKIVERMAHRIVNKLLHEPTTRLRAEAMNGHAPCYAYIVRDLFALDDLQDDL